MNGRSSSTTTPIDCSIGSRSLSDAELTTQIQGELRDAVLDGFDEDRSDRIVVQLFDDGDVVDRVERVEGLLVRLGESRRVVLGL